MDKELQGNEMATVKSAAQEITTNQVRQEMAAQKNPCDNAAGETAAGKGCRASTENGCTGHNMAAANPRCSDSGGAVEIAAAKMGLQTCQWNNCTNQGKKWLREKLPKQHCKRNTSAGNGCRASTENGCDGL